MTWLHVYDETCPNRVIRHLSKFPPYIIQDSSRILGRLPLDSTRIMVPHPQFLGFGACVSSPGLTLIDWAFQTSSSSHISFLGYVSCDLGLRGRWVTSLDLPAWAHPRIECGEFGERYYSRIFMVWSGKQIVQQKKKFIVHSVIIVCQK